MKPFTTIYAIKTGYLYSLHPRKAEFCILFGAEEGEKVYQQALANKERPSITGFIKYWRKATQSNFFDIIYKSQIHDR